MPRKSVKPDKNMYFQSREKAGLTRDAASELMEFISSDRIERIESGKSEPHPDEILKMSECYNDPLMANHYCTSECPIGRKYIPQVTDAELAAIVLQIMDSINGLSESKNKLVSITSDGVISDDEKPEFEAICNQLDRISSAATTLKFWMEYKIK